MIGCIQTNVNITKDENDSRTKSISITNLGLVKLDEATPIWLRIQEKAEQGIGKEKYKDLLETLKNLQESILD
ncbi:MarR family transcriptional regulator [Neobacillus bataviensis LMG 21833]|uniref:MarR family transcriptional regulator n=1 Tax=Neobacillus bataviensis LMG 21833 TaxID=1117379 RepID=K6EAK0_9BACI|nr:MarR family transcriptional regulator [Neobacillus bataviensis LMG 21833]